MAYVIGSQKGKDIAEQMKVGDTYEASDGSVWTKQSDGSVSVKTKDGGTYNNAYTPTNSASSGANSQYTNLGAQNVDYGTIGKQQMASGASWQDVLNTYNSRYNKASTTAGLEQYANDDIQKAMWQYVLSEQAKEAQNNAQAANQNWLDSYNQNNSQPTYEQKYDVQMDSLLNEILNRDDFSYNAQNDPLYQQYAAMYNREGDRAMRDTMAEAAAGAGGMNSYAITAAQQAANLYSSQLNDKIPELYQLAYEMYLNDKESKVQDLGLLQSMDATQYNRYRDTMSDWYNDRSFAYGAYQDAISQGNWQNNFNYNSLINDREFNYNDTWNNKTWNSEQEQKNLDNTRYDQEVAREEVWNLISLGVTPNADLIEKGGIVNEQEESLVPLSNGCICCNLKLDLIKQLQLPPNSPAIEQRKQYLAEIQKIEDFANQHTRRYEELELHTQNSDDY